MSTNPLGGILVDQPFKNAKLPSGNSLGNAILNDPKLLHWFQADKSYLTLSGNNITEMIDKTGKAESFINKTEDNCPSLVNGVFDVFSGARFNALKSNLLYYSAGVLDLTKPFSWAGVATLNSNSDSSNLMGVFKNSSERAIINAVAGASSLRFQYGGRTTDGVPIKVGEPFAFSVGFDGTNIYIRVNGMVVSAQASGGPSKATLVLGGLSVASQFWDGDISDIWICDTALNTEEGAGLLKKICDFTLNVYGIVL